MTIWIWIWIWIWVVIAKLSGFCDNRWLLEDGTQANSVIDLGAKDLWNWIEVYSEVFIIFSNPAGADFAGFGMTNLAGAGPDFQIDCNFTNLMCKTFRTYVWFEFLIMFLCSRDYLIFDREKSIRYSRPRISNVWEKSTFQSRQNYPAPVGFLPEPDFCRIWKSVGFRH